MAASSPAKKIPVLVTAMGGGGHGAQILKALRLSEEQKYFIVGADASPDTPNFSLTDQKEQLPFASEPGYIDEVLKLCKKYDVKALFHGAEAELRNFSEHRDAIRSQGIFLPINSAELLALCMDKARTSERLAELGFRVPKHFLASKLEELEEIDWFPVVIKPVRLSGGSQDVFIAQDQAELELLARYLLQNRSEAQLIVQEYVGTPDNEYTVGILHDMEGNYINSIAVKRLLNSRLNVHASVPNRTGREELGPHLVISSGISHGQIGRFTEVLGTSKEIAAALGTAGAINIQCRLVDGELFVFEINPRFSGTTSLRAMVGYNEPDILIRKHLLNESVPVDFAYEEGLILRTIEEHRVR